MKKIYGIMILVLLGLCGCSLLSFEQSTAVGRQYYAAGKYDAAQKAFEQAMQRSPDNYVPYLYLGWIAFAAHADEKAADYFARGIAKRGIPKKDKAELYFGAARVALRLKTWHSAIRYIQQALALDPEHVRAWLVCGWAHYEIGEIQEATNAFETVLNISPGISEAWYGLGWCAARKNNCTQVKKYADAALRYGWSEQDIQALRAACQVPRAER